MTTFLARGLLRTVLVVAAAAAAGTPGGVTPLPHPDLEPLGQVGEHLAEQIGRCEEVLAEPEASAARRAEAYGELGRLYLAYELWEPAAAALDRAVELVPGELRWSYYLGYVHRRAGDLEEAARWWERTLELRPDYLPALFRLGQVYLDLGLDDRIEPLIAGLPAAGEHRSAVAVLRGKAALARRDYEEARRQFEGVLAAEPGAGWVHYQLAQAYRGLGRIDDARRHLALQSAGSLAIADPLIHELPTLVGGAARYLRRAMAAYAAGRAEEAVAEYRRALDSDPRRTDIRTALAVILAESGQLEAAAEEYRRTLEMEPDLLLARYGLARTLARQGRHAEALEGYDELLAVRGEFTDALEGRAEALEALGRIGEALAARRRLVEAEPWNLDLRLAEGRALVRAGRLEEAAGELASVLAEDPARPAVALDLGGVYARLGRPEAADLFRSLIARPEAPLAFRAAAHFNLGQLLATGDPDRAEVEQAAEQFEAAVRLRPEWVEAQLRLGDALAAGGRHQRAAEAYGRAVALRPEDGEARLSQAMSLSLAGRYRQAVARLEEGFALFPRSGAFAHQLARLLAASPEEPLRDGARALELAAAVVRAERSVEHLATLAMALAENGRFDEAAMLQREAIVLAERRGDLPPARDRLRAALAGYLEGRPFRLGPASGGP